MASRVITKFIVPANLPDDSAHGPDAAWNAGPHPPSDPDAVISLNWGWQPVADQYGFILVKPASTYDPDIAPVELERIFLGCSVSLRAGVWRARLPRRFRLSGSTDHQSDSAVQRESQYGVRCRLLLGCGNGGAGRRRPLQFGGGHFSRFGPTRRGAGDRRSTAALADRSEPVPAHFRSGVARHARYGITPLQLRYDPVLWRYLHAGHGG
jgi:hypothetical protein